VNDASAFRGGFYPLQKAIKKYTGLEYAQFRNQAFAFYRKQLANMIPVHRPPRRTVTDYAFSQAMGIDSLFYLKQSYRSTPAFYLRTGGKEERLARQFISSEDWFSL